MKDLRRIRRKATSASGTVSISISDFASAATEHNLDLDAGRSKVRALRQLEPDQPEPRHPDLDAGRSKVLALRQLEPDQQEPRHPVAERKALKRWHLAQLLERPRVEEHLA